ncbi:MAG TPA: hypothetical protein VNQ74_02345 [Burkholderiaceae bacterium]|nr:hypothetical protein [Burkholderiaceae bacterium]
MRTTSSRFNAFVASIDANLEGRPAASANADTACPTGDTCLSVLERRHPAVIQTLRLLWGYPELNQYFEKVYSGRDTSLNLAPDAMAELMVLASVHQRICPHRPAATVRDIYGSSRLSDPWQPARLRR